MVLSKLSIKLSNDKMLASLSFVLFMPLLLDFISGLISGQSSTITMIIYGVSFAVFIVIGWHRIKMRNFLPLMIIYSICLINILLFPESKQYFEAAQYLILFYYLPLSFLLFRTIQSWDNFIPILFIFVPFAILMGAYILLFTQIAKLNDRITYMEFSYALLPFVCASYAYYTIKRKTIGLLLFLIGLIEMISFGCRGAILCAIILVFFLTIINSKRNKWGIIVLFIVVIVIALNVNTILNHFTGISFFQDSYVLKRAINAEMFEINTREDILMNCEKRLSSMGIEISGLFGDRPYCGSVYPHNIIYEVFMQWGWFLGGLFLLYLANLFIKGFFHNTTSRFVTIFFLCAIFLRFFVSGSYLNSGLFGLMIACMLSIKEARGINNIKM